MDQMMAHSQSGWSRHHLSSTELARIRDRVVALAMDTSDHSLPANASGIIHVKRATPDDLAFWNDISAKNFNLVLGFVVLVAFIAALPRWIDFFSAARGRSAGWRLAGSSRPATVVRSDFDSSLEKQSRPDKDNEKVPVEMGQAGSPRLATIVPTGALTARLRTLRTTYLLHSLPLPFNLLSHLSTAQVLVCLLYQTLVVFSLFYHCSNHSTNWKRTGYIAVAQLPAVFLAATKNGIGLVLGTSYEKINYLHRVAGRLVILASLIHALLFLRTKSWTINWQSNAQKTGMVGLLALVLVFFPSLKIIRSAFYQIFLVCHVGGVVLFIIALQLHAPSVARPYTISCLVMYSLDLLLRVCKTRRTLVSLAPLSSSTTMIQAHSLTNGWRAGQHVFVRIWFRSRWHESHPFTVAVASESESPLASGSRKLTLLAKSTGGFTRSLHEQSFASSSPLCCTIEGPYGHPVSLDFASFQSVLLFAAGTGITFCASVLEELIGNSAKQSSRNREITLVWSMSQLECIEWYRSFLTSLLRVVETETALSVSIYLHVTRTSVLPNSSPGIPGSYLSNRRPNLFAYVKKSVANVKHSLSASADSEAISPLVPLPNGGGVAVAVCGPSEFGNRVRDAVSRIEKEDALKV